MPWGQSMTEYTSLAWLFAFVLYCTYCTPIQLAHAYWRSRRRLWESEIWLHCVARPRTILPFDRLVIRCFHLAPRSPSSLTFPIFLKRWFQSTATKTSLDFGSLPPWPQASLLLRRMSVLKPFSEARDSLCGTPFTSNKASTSERTSGTIAIQESFISTLPRWYLFKYSSHIID
jgi:hypothetical protein